MLVVLDTSTLVAGVRSPKGASAEILRRVLAGQLNAACSVPLFFEYEAVLTRPEHLLAAGATVADIRNLLDAMAGLVTPVEVQFLWRPQLRDAADDMVLEAAVNVRAAAILTFNVRDFYPQIHKFGITVQTPGDFLKGVQ